MQEHFKNSFLLLKIFLRDKSMLGKMMWVMLSFSLSLAFVLCNLGLMQGYESIFREGLKETQGDFTIISREGFFNLDEEQAVIFNKMHEIKKLNFVVQTEVFMIYKDFSKAVQMRTAPDELAKNLTSGEVILGEAIGKEWNIMKGEQINLMFARGNALGEFLPEVKSYTVVGFKKHKLYSRDARILYGTKKDLADITNANEKFNLIVGELHDSSSKDSITNVVKKIQSKLGMNYSIKPFWHEFSGLLEAVQVEKNIITYALQLIILVAMFNMISFFRVLFETNYQSLFLLRALGLSLNSLKFFLLFLSLFLWLLANIGAKIWSLIFSWLLSNWSVLSLPGKIYHLGKIDLAIGFTEMFTVSILSLLWIIILWAWFVKKLSHANLVSVLKGEWR